MHTDKDSRDRSPNGALMTSVASVDTSITSPAEDMNFASRPPDSPDFRLRGLVFVVVSETPAA
jgi:hypothetical protein